MRWSGVDSQLEFDVKLCVKMGSLTDVTETAKQVSIKTLSGLDAHWYDYTSDQDKEACVLTADIFSEPTCCQKWTLRTSELDTPCVTSVIQMTLRTVNEYQIDKNLTIDTCMPQLLSDMIESSPILNITTFVYENMTQESDGVQIHGERYHHDMSLSLFQDCNDFVTKLYKILVCPRK